MAAGSSSPVYWLLVVQADDGGEGLAPVLRLDAVQVLLPE